MARVVFVDDDPHIIEVIKAIAELECGCEVYVFRNGADALKFLNTTSTDVVILDLRLPVLDGLTIAEEIRRNEQIHLIQPPVEIAFATGAPITDAITRVASRLNVRKIFEKPFDYLDLFREIKGWMTATAGGIQ